MQKDLRASTFGRIGRSYPRALPAERLAPPSSPLQRLLRRYRVPSALIAVLSALGLIGWFLGR